MESSAGLYWSPRWTLYEVTRFEVLLAVAVVTIPPGWPVAVSAGYWVVMYFGRRDAEGVGRLAAFGVDCAVTVVAAMKNYSRKISVTGYVDPS